MEYLLTFLEGMASFISPCMLPMIPLYLSYFAGEDEIDEQEPQTPSAVDKTESPAETTLQIATEETETSGNEKKSEGTKKTVVSERTDANKKASNKKHLVAVRSLFFRYRFYAYVRRVRRTCRAYQRLYKQAQNNNQYSCGRNRRNFRIIVYRAFQVAVFQRVEKVV